MENCGTNTANWDVFLLELPNLLAMPARVELPSPHFVCLLAVDARNVSASMIVRLVSDLLQKGLVFLCTWGPGCQRINHIFENIAIQHDLAAGREHPVTVSMSFEEDSLDVTLDFFQNVCHPNPVFEKTCKTGIVIPVGHAKLASYIRHWMTENNNVCTR